MYCRVIHLQGCSCGRFVLALHGMLALGLASLLWGGQSASAQELDAARILRLRAAFVFNFIQYASWPAQAFAEEESPIVVTVVGRDDIKAALERLVTKETVHGRRIIVREMPYPQPNPDLARSEAELKEVYERLRRSHLVYISTAERNRLHTILDRLDGADVLTVSDIPGFAEHGGMIGLAIRNNRMAFDANPDEIRKTNVTVSSKMLKLARIVKTRR